MADGKIIKWLKQEGQKVGKDEPLLEIEADKVTVEVESPGSGVLRKIIAPEGSVIPVSGLIGMVGQPEEELPDISKLVEKPPEVAAASTPEKVEKTKEIEAPAERIKISPLAKKLAAEHGVDIAKIKGTGPGGRIIKEDVLKVAEAGKVAPPTSPTVVAEKAEAVPLTGMRRTIAERMFRSLQTTAQLTITMEADVTEAVSLHKRELSKREISLTDMAVMSTVKALKEHSIVNSIFDGNQVKIVEDINMGIAVAVDEGLIVPVVRQADKKTLKELSLLTKNLVDKGRKGQLSHDEVSGGTFTVSNLGMFGVEVFTPILNPPETGILGVGKITERPSVVDGQIVARLKTYLSFTFDHRVIDGAKAAQFLSTVKQHMEDPVLLLL